MTNFMNSTRIELIQQLVHDGHVQMGPVGDWELTRKGRDLIDRLALLHELDDRCSGAAQASSPWRQASPAQTPEQSSSRPGRRRGDDDPPARGRQPKSTRAPAPPK
jgi:hypothetical protein